MGKRPPYEEFVASCKVLSHSKLAEKYDVSASTVAKWLKHYKFKLSDVSELSSVEKNRQANLNTWANPELVARQAVIANKVWQNEDLHKSHSMKMQQITSGSEYQNKMSESITKLRANPADKARISKQSKLNWTKPEFRDAQIKASINRWKSSEYRVSIVDSLKEYWTDERREFARVNQIDIWKDKELLARHSEISKDMWANAEFRQKVIDAVSSSWTDPVRNARLSESLKEYWSNPVVKEEASLRTAALFEDDEFRARHKKAMNRPELKSKLAISRQAQSGKMSKPHSLICTMLDALGINYETEKAIGPWNFDIFVPSHNLLLEIQGDYWHSLKKAILNDQSKATYVIEHFPQYTLKYIWEHECLSQMSVMAKLKYLLGIDKIDCVKFEFNDLVVKDVDVKVANTFLDTWHYQHHGGGGTNIGAYLGEELIGVARFTSPHRKEIATSLGYTVSEVLELSRFCIHPKYQKKNLGTWLLARARLHVKKLNPAIKCLVSFADSTYNHVGTIYKADNWELNRVVEPNYWYVDANGWVIHKKTLWNHASKMSIKESDYASKNGYTQVWGKEKYKYIKLV